MDVENSFINKKLFTLIIIILIFLFIKQCNVSLNFLHDYYKQILLSIFHEKYKFLHNNASNEKLWIFLYKFKIRNKFFKIKILEKSRIVILKTQKMMTMFL